MRRLGALFGVSGILFLLSFGSAPARAQSVDAGTVTGPVGGQATFSVTLNTGGATVIAVMNDIGFDSNAPIAATEFGTCAIHSDQQCQTDAACPDVPPELGGGKEPCVNVGAPSCTINAAINKGGFFSFLKTPGCVEPQACECTPGQDCTAIRAVVLGVNLTGIANGSQLYTCKVDISDTAVPGDYSLPVTEVGLADQNFDLVPNATGGAGKVTVIEQGLACACDCDVSGRVTGGEITKCVKILGGADLSICPAADSDHNGRVSGGDITRGVKALGAGTACTPM